MSDEQQKDQDGAEVDSAAVVEGASGGAKAQVKQQSMLSRPSDFVARPGFRNPPNQASKAQKKSKSRR